MAVIAAHLAAVGHMQLAATMTTAQQPGQQQLTASHRPFDRGTAFAIRIIGNHALVLLKLVPRDVALMLLLEQNIPFGHGAAQQLVAGFSGPPNLPESRREAGFSAAVPGSGKIRFSGGLEWLEAVVGKRFPRNWVSDCLNNLSCRTCPSVAAARHRSSVCSRSSTTFCNCSIWAANGRNCRSTRIRTAVPKSTTRAFIVRFGDGRPTAAWMPFSPAR